MLDDGRITDGQGRTGDFRNTVLIMTSNIGSQHILHESNSEQREALVTEALRNHFRPEFLNRIDRADLTTIVDLQLDRVRKRLAKQGLALALTEAAKVFHGPIMVHPYSPQPFARFSAPVGGAMAPAHRPNGPGEPSEGLGPGGWIGI